LPPLPLYRFSVDQYHRMIAAGILTEDDPVELLEGLLVVKTDHTSEPVAEIRCAGNGSPDLPLPIYPLTVEQYQRMIDTGILGAGDRVELLAGWVVEKMPHNPPHDAVVYRIQRDLFRRLPDEWICRGQSAVELADSRPEPDLAIVRGPAERYEDHHPGPPDIALLMEVADSTVERDRTLKGPMYAHAAIAVYWTVNLVEAQIEVYTDPSGPAAPASYRQRRDYLADETVPLVLAGQVIQEIPARDFLRRVPPS
jgi:hypothetical protein